MQAECHLYAFASRLRNSWGSDAWTRVQMHTCGRPTALACVQELGGAGARALWQTGCTRPQVEGSRSRTEQGPNLGVGVRDGSRLKPRPSMWVQQ